MKALKETKSFLSALNTLLYTWGGDTPVEATWAANEFLNFYEKETGRKIGYRMKESWEDDEDKVIKGMIYTHDFEKIKKAIRRKKEEGK